MYTHGPGSNGYQDMMVEIRQNYSEVRLIKITNHNENSNWLFLVSADDIIQFLQSIFEFASGGKCTQQQ